MSEPRPQSASSKRNEVAQLRDDSKVQARILWSFAIIWNLLSWPVAAVVWPSAGWTLGSFFVALFPLAGLLLIWAAMTASLMVNRFRGTEVSTEPAAARIGERLCVHIALPASRLTKRQRQFELRIIECRIRDDDSNPSPREEWTARQGPIVQMLANGDGVIEAEFLIPDFCAPTGKVIDGERVLWFLELIDLSNSDLQKFDMPVSPKHDAHPDIASSCAEPVGLAPQPAGMRSRRWSRAGQADGVAAAPVPRKVMCVKEGDGTWSAQFPAAARYWVGMLLLLLTIGAFWAARREFAGDSSMSVLAAVLLVLVGWAGIAMCMHYFSKRWKLLITQHGMMVEHSSLLRTRHVPLANGDLVELMKKTAYPMRAAVFPAYFQIHAATRSGDRIQLTPGIPSEQLADAVADAIRSTQANYTGLFTPLRQNAPAASRRKIAGIVLYIALALAAFGVVGLPIPYVFGDPVNPLRIARDWAIRLERLTPAGLRYEELIAAQDRSDLPALEALLKQGANPDTVANNGSSLLMLAARRGNLPHVELLLRYGADVNRRDETSNNNRGDSALLVALHAGHEKVVRRLLEAGAQPDVRNMWDWGPMHMAAQGNCIPCLNLLKEKGFSIGVRAHASRGETPAMLAAARGRLEALQWFVANGVDLNERDAHGKTALEWAVFFDKENTAAWIRGNGR